MKDDSFYIIHIQMLISVQVCLKFSSEVFQMSKVSLLIQLFAYISEIYIKYTVNLGTRFSLVGSVLCIKCPLQFNLSVWHFLTRSF